MHSVVARQRRRESDEGMSPTFLEADLFRCYRSPCSNTRRDHGEGTYRLRLDSLRRSPRRAKVPRLDAVYFVVVVVAVVVVVVVEEEEISSKLLYYVDAGLYVVVFEVLQELGVCSQTLLRHQCRLHSSLLRTGSLHLLFAVVVAVVQLVISTTHSRPSC